MVTAAPEGSAMTATPPPRTSGLGGKITCPPNSTTFSTRATSELSAIHTVRQCARASILGEFDACGDTAFREETGFPDTGDN